MSAHPDPAVTSPAPMARYPATAQPATRPRRSPLEPWRRHGGATTRTSRTGSGLCPGVGQWNQQGSEACGQHGPATAHHCQLLCMRSQLKATRSNTALCVRPWPALSRANALSAIGCRRRNANRSAPALPAAEAPAPGPCSGRSLRRPVCIDRRPGNDPDPLCARHVNRLVCDQSSIATT